MHNKVENQSLDVQKRGSASHRDHLNKHLYGDEIQGIPWKMLPKHHVVPIVDCHTVAQIPLVCLSQWWIKCLEREFS